MISVFPPAGWASAEGLVPPIRAARDSASSSRGRERLMGPSFLHEDDGDSTQPPAANRPRRQRPLGRAHARAPRRAELPPVTSGGSLTRQRKRILPPNCPERSAPGGRSVA